NRSNIWRSMKKLCKRTGIDCQKVFPHNLRHLFAKTFYNSAKDLAKLADVLGHSRIETTRIYVMENGQEHERMVEMLGLTEDCMAFSLQGHKKKAKKVPYQ
ncbi:tyrosine-type recombinase/integrase, partial [Enterocloster sp.]|uniref:tyrosine-type recombinase/integrase n=1 Tax=Enterocloster sp. TaxID=2719315 RepID=UPI003AF66A46